jgi:hypothetical protein
MMLMSETYLLLSACHYANIVCRGLERKYLAKQHILAILDLLYTGIKNAIHRKSLMTEML